MAEHVDIFRSAEARERYLRHYDARAKSWPAVSKARTVETSDGQTYVRVSGPAGAPPLVLLHGIGGNSLQWLPNVEALSARHQTYAVDNIYDYGRSVCTRIMRSADDFVGWLDELFDALRLGNRINLVGLSYGGWLTAQYALRFPHRLRKAVLLAPAGTVLPLSLAWIARAALCAIPHRYFTRSFLNWLLHDLARTDAGRIMVEEWVDDSFIAVRSFKPKPLVNPAA